MSHNKKKGMWEGVNKSLYKTQRTDVVFFFPKVNIVGPVRHSLEQHVPFFEGIYKMLQN